MSFWEAIPPNHPPGALPLDPAGGLPFSRPPVPPPPNPGCATASASSYIRLYALLNNVVTYLSVFNFWFVLPASGCITANTVSESIESLGIILMSHMMSSCGVACC